MDHVTAASLMAQARDRSNGKPLQNNTRLYDRGEDDFAVRLHYTDVVTIHADGSYTLRTGGWETVTTRDRITTYAPVYGTLRTRDGDWQLRVRPSVSDPEPEVRRRTIPKPFHAPDPGPEPEKDPHGCVAGHLLVRGIMETEIIWDPPLALDRPFKLRRNCRPKIYHPERIANAPNAARAVCEYLKQAFGSGKTIHVERPGVERIEFGEVYAYHAPDRKMPSWKYERCPHCIAFDQRRDAWRTAMHGGYRQVGRRYRYHQGYALMVEMLERFGTREAWQEAYIAEFRQQREDSKRHREWESRNYVSFHDGVRVDREGYVPRKDAEEIFKAERAAKRARRRAEIEHEQRQREARQLQRFKDRVRRKRGDNFDTLVVELGNDVRAWKARLEDEND